MMKRLIIALVIVLIIAGCQNNKADLVTYIPDLTVMAPPRLDAVPATETPSPTPEPTSLPTSTPTPSPTPSPTPTARPLTVTGDPRAASLKPPEPQDNAPCGLVDLLDFPVDPPDGDDVSRGGSDFGVYRGRFSKYHAGEDWWGVRGRSSFGTPIYAIGHGRVTYAAPLGWGRDQGIVIVEHRFPDGDTVLSFYGHLDPPSVILDVGDCVIRGEQVGQIGKPRTAAHLHFEVRSHMPDEPGTGYWPVDPTLAGWKPPSQTIWDNRMSASPGVDWTRPVSAGGTRGVGLLNDNTFVAIEDDRLIGIGLLDGALVWGHGGSDDVSFEVPEDTPDGLSTEVIAEVSAEIVNKVSNDVEEAMIDAVFPVLYAADQLGRIVAFQVDESQEENGAGSSLNALTPLWTMDLDLVGFPTFYPLPGGGALMSVWDHLVAISHEGSVLWEEDSVGQPFDWVSLDESLVFTTEAGEGSLWTAGESGLDSWSVPLSGHLVGTGDQLLLYAEDGLYRLNPETKSAERLLELSPGRLSLGDAIAVPDGGLLIAHADRFDRRLLALEASGDLRWERSYSDLIEGQISFLALDGELYLMAWDDQNSSAIVSIFSIDVQQAEVTHIFTGGTRSAIPNQTGVFTTAGDIILINIGGGSSVAFQPQVAKEILLPAAED